MALTVIAVLGFWAGRSRAGVTATFVLALIFLSPLCALSSALFSAGSCTTSCSSRSRRLCLRWLVRPGADGAWAGPFLFATAVLWLWHLPDAYDAALSDMALYWVMQGSLLGSAWVFWRAAFSEPAGSGLGWVFLAYLAMGMLGAILTLAPEALYAAHAIAPLAVGNDAALPTSSLVG